MEDKDLRALLHEFGIVQPEGQPALLEALLDLWRKLSCDRRPC